MTKIFYIAFFILLSVPVLAKRCDTLDVLIDHAEKRGETQEFTSLVLEKTECAIFAKEPELAIPLIMHALNVTDGMDTLSNRCRLHFLLAKIYLDAGENDLALKFIVAGNAFVSLAQDYNLLGEKNTLMALYYSEDLNKSIRYYQKAVEAYEHTDKYEETMQLHITLGSLYFNANKWYQARSNMVRALNQSKEYNLGVGAIITSYLFLIDIEERIGGFNRATYEIEVDGLVERFKGSMEINQSLAYMLDHYVFTKAYEKVLMYGDLIVDGNPQLEVFKYENVAEAMYKAHKASGNGDEAVKYLELHIQVQDSLFSMEKLEYLNKLHEEFQTERREKQISSLEVSNLLQTKALKDEAEVKMYFAIGFGVVVVLLFFVVRGYKQKREAHDVIITRNDEIEKQKKIVDIKNNEIIDSIEYAERLQRAILPSMKNVLGNFEDAFVLFSPRDIVSGDFYWTERIGDDVFIAAVDCTGHGVPGAMVSVVGANALHRCVMEFDLREPAAILDKLSELVEATFGRSGQDIQDGMDLGLAKVNLKEMKMTYAGANNPAYLIREIRGEESKSLDIKYKLGSRCLFEVKGDKQPIGKYSYRKPFQQTEVPLRKGDSVYLLTDGYVDQFGGPRGKKFKSKRLKNMLLKIQFQPMLEQRANLHETFSVWKSSLDQVDDVCVIGFKV